MLQGSTILACGHVYSLGRTPKVVNSYFMGCRFLIWQFPALVSSSSGTRTALHSRPGRVPTVRQYSAAPRPAASLFYRDLSRNSHSNHTEIYERHLVPNLETSRPGWNLTASDPERATCEAPVSKRAKVTRSGANTNASRETQ